MNLARRAFHPRSAALTIVVAMGHDAHFLSRLDRVAQDHVEVALGLYRDHEAVRFVLDRLEDKGERIAISLADDRRGPFVVVAQNGHFVTCLGQDMSPGALHVVPRSRLDALLHKYRDQRERISTRDLEQHEGESAFAFYQRLMRRGDAMSREQFVALSSMQPLLASTFLRLAIEASGEVGALSHRFRNVKKLRGDDIDAARVFEQKRWLAGHMVLLATMGARAALATFADHLPRKPVFSLLFTTLGSTTMALRGAWAAARFGKDILPSYRAAARDAADGVASLDVAIAMVAMGLRHRALRDDARRALDTLEKAPAALGEAASMRQEVARLALETLESPSTTNAIARGREIFFDITRHLKAGDPARFETEEDIPETLARTALLAQDADPYRTDGLNDLFDALPLLAEARAEDFYFPRAVAPRILFEPEPRGILQVIRRFDHVFSFAGETVRAETKPGRNDPCSCGSGKKYKKCCATPAKPASA